MTVKKLDGSRPEMNGKEDVPKKKKHGCLNGCLVTIFLSLYFFLAFQFLKAVYVLESLMSIEIKSLRIFIDTI